MILIDNLSAILPELITCLMRAVTATHGLWSTRGSGNIAPSMLITGDSPPVTGFAAFLDSDWERWGWKDADRFSTAPQLFEL